MNAKEIKALRKRRGETQNEFAHKLKVDPITVSRWERGEQRPKLSALVRLKRLARKA